MIISGKIIEINGVEEYKKVWAVLLSFVKNADVMQPYVSYLVKNNIIDNDYLAYIAIVDNDVLSINEDYDTLLTYLNKQASGQVFETLNYEDLYNYYIECSLDEYKDALNKDIEHTSELLFGN